MENNENKWLPFQGELVWIYYLNAQNRHGTVTVSIAPRHFEKVIHNYLNKPDNLRWSLVIPHAPMDKNYGTAFRPENVYKSREEALLALRHAVIAKINQLEDALRTAMQGGGVS